MKTSVKKYLFGIMIAVGTLSTVPAQAIPGFACTNAALAYAACLANCRGLNLACVNACVPYHNLTIKACSLTTIVAVPYVATSPSQTLPAPSQPEVVPYEELEPIR